MFSEVELEEPLAFVPASVRTRRRRKPRAAGKSRSPSSTGVILPIVITLIVITLAAFSLVALYRMCQKKTPGIWFAFSERGKNIYPRAFYYYKISEAFLDYFNHRCHSRLIGKLLLFQSILPEVGK